MKKEQLQEQFGLRCGQRIEDSEGIQYLICNDLLGNVSILRIRDSVLFSGDEAMYLIEDIAKSLYFRPNEGIFDIALMAYGYGGLSEMFTKSETPTLDREIEKSVGDSFYKML